MIFTASAPPDLGVLSEHATVLASTMASISSDIALVIDEGGFIVSVADEGAKLSPACGEWVGKRWIDTATDDTRRKIELLLDEVRSKGVTRRREVNHSALGGDSIPVAWSAVRLGPGGPVLAVGRDLRAVAAIQQRFIEAQQEMEQAYWRRRHADNRYRMLFQVASDAVFVVDATTFDITEANGAASLLLGDGAALIGRSFVDVALAGSRGAVRELLGIARSAGRASEARIRLAHEREPVELSVTPFRVGEDHHLVLRARRAELQVDGENNLARMAEFVENTPDGVVITDAAGHVQAANPAFVELVGRGDESCLKGRLLHEVLGDADGRVRSLVAMVRTHGVAPRTTIELESSSGRSVLDVELTAALMTDGDQERIGFTLRPNVSSRGAAIVSSGPAGDIVRAFSELSSQVGRVPLPDLLAEAAHLAEKFLISNAVMQAGGQISIAADRLGLTPGSLMMRLKRHGLAGGVYESSTTIN